MKREREPIDPTCELLPEIIGYIKHLALLIRYQNNYDALESAYHCANSCLGILQADPPLDVVVAYNEAIHSYISVRLESPQFIVDLHNLCHLYILL